MPQNEGDDAYLYEPLSGPKSIRLVYLHSGSSEEPLSVEMKEIDITLDQKYTALSYVWGATDGSISLKCARKTLLITPNLAEALRCLRSETDTLCLWIDALCINQHNTTEKNHQVAMMRDIYERAQRTVMFIGSEGPDTKMAYGLIEKLCHVGKKYLPHLTSKELFSAILPSTDVSLEIDFKDERPWNGLIDILMRPYFDRAWIIQEILASKHPYVMCGIFHTRWNLFKGSIAVARAMTTVNGIPKKLSLSLKNRSACLQLLHICSQRQIRSVSGVLGMFQRSQATDPRDKVYAFLGISTLSESIISKSTISLVQDYGKPVHEVYMEAARYILYEASSLSFWDTSHQPHRNKILSLPSWAPDWSRDPRSLGYWNPAAYGLKDIVKYDPSVESGSLFIDGVIIDRISYSIPVTSRSTLPKVVRSLSIVLYKSGRHLLDRYPHGICAASTQGSTRRRFLQVLRICREQFSPSSYPSLNIEAFWRTITRDVIREEAGLAMSKPDFTLTKVLRSLCWMASEQAPLLGRYCTMARQLDENRSLESEMSRYIREDVEFYITEKGYFGIGPTDEAKEGMVVAILGGARAPWLLEKTKISNENWYKLVSQTYMVNVDGITKLEEGSKTERIEIR